MLNRIADSNDDKDFYSRTCMSSHLCPYKYDCHSIMCSEAEVSGAPNALARLVQQLEVRLLRRPVTPFQESRCSV